MPRKARYAYFRVRRGWSRKADTLALSSDGARMAVIRLWDEGKTVDGTFASEAELREAMGGYRRFIPELRAKQWLDGLDIVNWDEDQAAVDPDGADRQRRRRARLSGTNGAGVTPLSRPESALEVPLSRPTSRTPTETLTETLTETEPPHTPPGRNVTPRRDRAAEDQVFAEWQAVTGHRNARFGDDRRRKVRARLSEYPLEDVIDAVHGITLSPHHQGQNDTGTVYDDLELICRDGKHVEKFRDLCRGEARQMPTNAVDREILQLARQPRSLEA